MLNQDSPLLSSSNNDVSWHADDTIVRLFFSAVWKFLRPSCRQQNFVSSAVVPFGDRHLVAWGAAKMPLEGLLTMLDWVSQSSVCSLLDFRSSSLRSKWLRRCLLSISARRGEGLRYEQQRDSKCKCFVCIIGFWIEQIIFNLIATFTRSNIWIHPILISYYHLPVDFKHYFTIDYDLPRKNFTLPAQMHNW